MLQNINIKQHVRIVPAAHTIPHPTHECMVYTYMDSTLCKLNLCLCDIYSTERVSLFSFVSTETEWMRNEFGYIEIAYFRLNVFREMTSFLLLSDAKQRRKNSWGRYCYHLVRHFEYICVSRMCLCSRINSLFIVDTHRLSLSCKTVLLPLRFSVKLCMLFYFSYISFDCVSRGKPVQSNQLNNLSRTSNKQ